MILDLDMGNSRIKWRSSAEPKRLQVNVSDDELYSSWGLLQGVKRVRIAAVVDAARVQEISLWCWRHWQVDVEVAVVKSNIFGVQIAYRDTSTFGVDRWLAMQAVNQQADGLDAIVVSGGTALTVDYLSADGRHRGGYIFPGWRAAMNGLLGEADRISVGVVSLGGDWQPGVSTMECLDAGIAMSYRSLVRALSEVPLPDFSAKKMVFTGGDGEWLLAQVARTDIALSYDPMLVLQGLGIVLP